MPGRRHGDHVVDDLGSRVAGGPEDVDQREGAPRHGGEVRHRGHAGDLVGRGVHGVGGAHLLDGEEHPMRGPHGVRRSAHNGDSIRHQVQGLLDFQVFGRPRWKPLLQEGGDALPRNATRKTTLHGLRCALVRGVKWFPCICSQKRLAANKYFAGRLGHPAAHSQSLRLQVLHRRALRHQSAHEAGLQSLVRCQLPRGEQHVRGHLARNRSCQRHRRSRAKQPDLGPRG
mmetsp:Transcript_93868/g.184041  ORF Transcript_93868/g.184041 Transcript_93868/m.184041 type:complete len:229 (-) Transcript_93868:418-1104(-)